MANQQITLTLPDEALRITESRIASGEYTSPSDVVADSLVRSGELEGLETFDDWLAANADGLIAEANTPREQMLTAEQMRQFHAEQIARLRQSHP